MSIDSIISSSKIIITYLDQATIVHQLVDDRIQGFACACFADYAIYYHYDDGIKEGPALKLFKDGSYIQFNYREDEAEGPAIKVFTDGSLIHFIYRNGIAEEN